MRTTTKSAALVVCLATAALAADPMADGFKRPSHDARPWTWWHWVSGNVSKEGITADLEAMNRIGLGGLQAFSVDQGPRAEKPVLYMSQQWRDLMKHSVAEASRLNLDLTMHACEGWSESGGPWIRPEQSMQKVVWTETPVQGPTHVDLVLTKPEATSGVFSDVAVIAFPKRPGDEANMRALKPRTRASGGTDAAAVADGDVNTKIDVQPDKDGSAFVEAVFDRPVRIGSVGLSPVSVNAKGEFQISTDGKTFKRVGVFSTTTRAKGQQVVDVEPVEVRAVRAYMPKVAEGKPWTVGELAVTGPRIPNYVYRSGMESRPAPAPMPTSYPAELVIPQEGVVDLTERMTSDGHLVWDAPAGEWVVLRLASTSTNMTNHPAMPETRGLECDKLDRKVIQTQFARTVGQVVDDAGELAGKGIKWALLDSWEAGCQNWTPMFREEFVGRRHYDPRPWMPALTGRVVGSIALTDRFLWDYRLTIAELLAENHYGLFADLCHQNGLKLMSEAVGINMPTVADQLQCKGRVDVPMGEFWTEREPRDYDPKEAASAAHIYGQNVAAAEAFTAQAQVAGWRNDPASLKALGDKMFTLGINHFVFHRYAHQPYLDRAPGVTMGPWGINFERTNTWWEPGRAWVEYIARCQEMLKRGRFVADVCYYYGEGAPIGLQIEALKPAPPAGYDYDACNREVLLSKMSVEKGEVVLESGMRYRALVLPETDRMTPEVARKVRELVKAGATVVGPRPVASPSLVGWPKCDEEVAAIGREVWGDCDGKSAKEHRYGKGRVVMGRELAEVVGVAKDFEANVSDMLGIPADFTAKAADVRYIHRRDGNAEVYFVSNQAKEGRVVDCTFRVKGMRPELWWGDTGKMERAGMWWEKGGRTTVRVPLEAAGSVFVVFREKSSARGGVLSVTESKPIHITGRLAREGGKTLEILSAEYGAIEEGGPKRDVTQRLAGMVKDGTLVVNATNNALGGDAARNQHKQLRVEYRVDGRQEGSVTVAEGQELKLPPGSGQVAGLDLPVEVAGDEMTVWRAGAYVVMRAERTRGLEVGVDALPKAVEVTGPWRVSFEKGRGGPEGDVTFEKLVSWTDRPEAGVKYFSGTGTYEAGFNLPAVAKGDRVRLDLGEVKNLAEVRVNGKGLGVLWKAPFVVDATDAVKEGENRIEVRVTNLWVNRLIGDQTVPEGKRVTWTTYNPYKKDSPLLPSGLIGPVRVEFGRVVSVSK